LNLLRRFDTPLTVALIVAAAYGVVIRQIYHARNDDISMFVVAGGPGIDAARVPPGLTIIPGIGGYDGMIFYRLALEPFTHERVKYGIALDNPAYRQQRIGYPLIVWLLSFGEPKRVPLMLIVVNVLALIGIGVAGAAIARRFGAPAIWGLAFALYPGFLMSVSRDCAEPVAWCFALASIATRRPWLSAALLSYAVLTRETTLVLPLAALVVWLWSTLRHRTQVIDRRQWIMPIATWTGWQLFLAARWNQLPARAGAPAISAPFVEFVRFLQMQLPRHSQQQRLYFVECVFWLVVIALVAFAWRRSQARPEWRIAFVAFLALSSVMARQIWNEDYGFMRIFSDLFATSALIAGATPQRTVRWLFFASTVATWWHVASLMR
jgi:hypothetical protein